MLACAVVPVAAESSKDNGAVETPTTAAVDDDAFLGLLPNMA
jgi:hypothetical protein